MPETREANAENRFFWLPRLTQPGATVEWRALAGEVYKDGSPIWRELVVSYPTPGGQDVTRMAAADQDWCSLAVTVLKNVRPELAREAIEKLSQQPESEDTDERSSCSAGASRA